MTHCSFRQGLRSFFLAFSARSLDRESRRSPVPPAYPPRGAASRTRAPAAPGCTRWPPDGLPARRRVCAASSGRVVGGAGRLPARLRPPAGVTDGWWTRRPRRRPRSARRSSPGHRHRPSAASAPAVPCLGPRAAPRLGVAGSGVPRQSNGRRTWFPCPWLAPCLRFPFGAIYRIISRTCQN